MATEEAHDKHKNPVSAVDFIIINVDDKLKDTTCEEKE